MWASPIASIWDPLADFEAVYRLGSILAALEAGEPTAAMHAQAAHLEGQLGLTPRSRASMRVRLDSDPKPGARGRARRSFGRPSDSTGPDPRQALADRPSTLHLLLDEPPPPEDAA